MFDTYSPAEQADPHRLSRQDRIEQIAGPKWRGIEARERDERERAKRCTRYVRKAF